MEHRQTRAQRYLPFVGLAAVLVALQILQPVATTRPDVSVVGQTPGAAGAPAAPGGFPGATGTGSFGGAAATTGGSAGQPAASDAVAARSPAASAGVPAEPGAQAVDALGRPLDGDRSGCAPGGQLQQDITTQAIPCVPKLEGDNGGATYQGVAADSITMVMWGLRINEANQALLQAIDFEMTQQQYEDAVAALEKHYNKRYNLYGRTLEIVNYYSDCAGTSFGESPDPTCFRADAKAVIERYRPFAVTAQSGGDQGLPTPAADEVARARVMTLPHGGLSRTWYNARRPYAWQLAPDGSLVADMGAEYYCKKLHGKNATRAGDPTYQVTTRKLGITSYEDPEYADSAERPKAHVTGGLCGSADDGTTVYTYSSDTNRAADQMPTLLARMKNDGITTTYGLEGPVCGYLATECDNQRYHPEHVLGGQNAIDCDACGRLVPASQRRNMFGLGFYPAQQPLRNFDFHRAIRDGNPQYDDPPYLTEQPWKPLAVYVPLMQMAGPRLTPENVERGALSMPQINGWQNANPWPGWKCCNPLAIMGKFGPEDYTMRDDAREIAYFDETQTSPVDGKQGMWVATDNSRRWSLGTWPRGDAPTR